MGMYKRNNAWYIDYYFQGRRKREKVGPGKALAEKALSKRKVEIAESKFLDIRKNEKIKFEDFADEFLRLHSRVNKKPSSSRRDVGLIKNLSVFFGGMYLYAITSIYIEKYKIKRLVEVSPATVNREVACLKCMFNKAIEWDKIEVNPVRKVKLLKENNARLRYLEKEETTRLLSNCKGVLKAIVITALNTGMRRGEILNLQWKDVDFKRDIIYVGDTKNGEGREQPMNDMVTEALSNLPRYATSEHIFCKANGEPYIKFDNSFFTALKKSDIVKFRFHDLRHTFASQLAMAGIDINTIRELLGHKSINMTLRYAHLSPNHKRQAVDVLNDHIAPIQPPDEKTETLPKQFEAITLYS